MTATNHSCNPSTAQRPRWTREQIRAARVAALAPLLQQRHLELIARPADNFELAAYPGLLVKDSYWRWPQRQLAGNAIDFFVQVLGLSFHDASAAQQAALAHSTMPVRCTLTGPLKNRWYDANSVVHDLWVGLTMAVPPSSQMGLTQDASTMSDRQESPLKATPTQPGRSRTTPAWQCGHKVRCQRGNLAKTLRRHFGSFYDRKKIGNTECARALPSRSRRRHSGQFRQTE